MYRESGYVNYIYNFQGVGDKNKKIIQGKKWNAFTSSIL